MNMPYYNPYPQYYGQPVPDQLAQLRQGGFQPQPQQIPPQQTPQSCEVVWVSGEGEANGYMVAPGSKVILMDRDMQTFYVKCRDVNNMPYPMEVYDYHKREAAPAAKPQTENFVTRAEFDALAAAFGDLKSQMQAKPQKAVKEAANAKPAVQQT
jgi:cell pole-organizing protein PopZ